MRFKVFAAYHLAAVCLAGSVFAQTPRRVRFEYARRPGAGACPEGGIIQAGVSARLGYEPFDDKAGDVVRVTVQSSGHGLEAQIEMTDATGGPKAERRLVSRERDCAELASAVELAVSIAIDPFRLSRATVQQDPGVAPGAPADHRPDKESARSGPEVCVANAPATVAQRGPLSGLALAGVVGSLGAAPSPAVGVVIGAALRAGGWSLGLEGRADLPASKGLRAGEATTGLLAASLVPCAHLGVAAVCALGTAGALRASGHGLVDARQVTLPYAAVGARLALAFPVSPRWSARLHGDVTAPLTESKVVVDGDVVWTSPILSAALGLGVAANFP